MVQYTQGYYMTTIRCYKCDGKKTIIGLGMINKECDCCHGVGHVKVADAAEPKDKKRS